jgi:hypothetical protein
MESTWVYFRAPQTKGSMCKFLHLDSVDEGGHTEPIGSVFVFSPARRAIFEGSDLTYVKMTQTEGDTL